MEDRRVPFQNVVDAVLDARDFPHAYLRYFSDIDPGALGILMEAWPRVEPSRKHWLLEQLEATAAEDTLVSFDDFARALLADPDPLVRGGAIRLLEENADPKLVAGYIRTLETDEDEDVRAEAARALGQFVMLGELEEIPEPVHRSAEDALLRAANGGDAVHVRRRAVEALGFSARPEVTTLIDSAFRRQDPEWKASALFAMGRSSDERWEEPVLQMILNDNPRVRLAAVQAAGELGLAPARSILIGLMEDEEEDDIVGAAIWSLSQIGGEDARSLIESLIGQAEDDELTEFLEDALENLAFTEDLERFDLMSFDPEDVDEEDEE
ncbi:MAG: HEAT repeat domain-containing protein [Bacteroidota bacterium]